MKKSAICEDFFLQNLIFRLNRASKREKKILLGPWVLYKESLNEEIFTKSLFQSIKKINFLQHS